MPPIFFNSALFGMELLFAVIIFVLCLIIYLKTKESYQLTKHRGIKYFRDAFLFFGISYLVRFSFMLAKLFFDIRLFRGELGSLFILPLGYLSTIAIFYLGLSIVWRKFNTKYLIFFSHTTAVLLAITSFITRSHLILIYIQSLFLIITVILIFINQIRQKISSMSFGNNETTSGGNALKFYSSLRLDVRRIGGLKKNDVLFGNRIAVKVVKNKVAAPFKRVELDLLFTEGISRELDLLDAAIHFKVIKQSGSWFSLGDKKFAQGREQALSFLKEHSDTADAIHNEVKAMIREQQSQPR